jgi:mycofactocin glycosyltransferase
VPEPPLPCELPVPAGFRLRRDPGVSTHQRGRVLLGGAPYRLLRLGPRGTAQVSAWWEGAPVPGRPAAGKLARRLLDVGMAHPVPDGGPSPGDVTVVIPVRDRAAELRRCLAGLAGTAGRPHPAGTAGRPHPAGTAGPPYPAEAAGSTTRPAGAAGHTRAAGAAGPRVIVVDDGSARPEQVAAAAAAAGARCLRRDHCGGPGAARNTGLAAATTPLVAFVDSDCVPGPDWLAPLLPHFADPAVAAAAPRIVPHGGGEGWLARYEGISSTLDMGAAESLVRPGTKVPYVPGAALVVRRDAAAAGFAEDMPVGEDVDFVWRLAAAGWHVRYEPRATMPHQHRVRLRSWFARRADYGTSAAPLEQRHPGTLPALSMSGWSAVAWLAAVAGCPMAGAAVVGGTTALLARRLTPFTDDPWPLAARLAGGGTVAAGRLLGSTLSRAWWPLALPAAVAVRRLRLPLAALVLAPPLLGWRERRPPMDPVSYAAARLLDDVAYSVGVWRGCLAGRTARPLLPALWWWSAASEPGGPRPGHQAPPRRQARPGH